MTLQIGETSYDATLICTLACTGIFWIGYLLFAYRVTHTGDFYQIRRWKAAVWLAGISTGLVSFILLFLFVVMGVVNSSKSDVDVIGLAGVALFFINHLAIPFVIIITLGTHYQIKRWLLSDDYLDKIWKDPNKNKRSPIQEI